jgi:hypothetical protein
MAESQTRKHEADRKEAREPPPKGNVLAALCRSPMVGAQLDLRRPVIKGRDIDL